MNPNQTLMIKSLTNGLRLVMDPEADFEDILCELAKRLSDGRSFFGNNTMAISVEGRELSEVEEFKVLDTIRINSNLNVICIIDHDEEMNYKYIKAIKSMEKRYSEICNPDNGGNFFKGSLTDGERLEVDYPVVILGDVNAGCSVVSTSSIIVLGGLYGEAIIKDTLDEDGITLYFEDEVPNESDPFVMALEMAPEKLEINHISYIPAPKSKWGKHKIQPGVVYPKGDKLVLEPISKATLETIYAL